MRPDPEGARKITNSMNWPNYCRFPPQLHHNSVSCNIYRPPVFLSLYHPHLIPCRLPTYLPSYFAYLTPLSSSSAFTKPYDSLSFFLYLFQETVVYVWM